MRLSASLHLKLALSHLLVLLLAVGVTVGANYLLFRKGFDQRMLAETQARCQEAARRLEAGGAATYQQSLDLLAAEETRTPVKFSLVPLMAPSREAPGFLPFPLTEAQRAILMRGGSVSGPFNEASPPRSGHFSAYPVRIQSGAQVFAVVAYAVRMTAPLGKPVMFWILQSLALALLPAAFLATRLARHVVDPILVCQEAATRVAQGDYSARSRLQRDDELGAVSRDFDAMAQKLEADFEVRTRLLGDISHELATPVTTLRATAEALLDGLIQEPEDLRMCHQSILRQVEHLSFLVSDVTELARYETGEVSLVHRAFSAPDPLEQAVESARMTAYQYHSEVITETSPAWALGDSRRILQVLKNLVHNALDHNPPETTVWVSCRPVGDQVEYSVEDDGVAIPVEQREAIFERFIKLDPSRPRGLSGGGLGLSIVSEILKAHGSAIAVSETPRGKAFTFSLRRASK